MLGTDQQSGYRYSDFFRCYIDFSESQYVDWVSGCCMLLPTDFIKKYGFLDVEYFMFLEDADICRRAHRVGKKVKYIAEAEVVHHRGGSSKGDGGKMKPFLFLETQRSRLRFLRKESFFQYLLYFMFIYPFIGLKLMRSYWRGDIGWSNEVLGRLVKMPLH